MLRKVLIEKLEKRYNVKARYLGVPSCNYEIVIDKQIYIIDKEGTITAGNKKVGHEDILNGLYYKEDILKAKLEYHTGQSLKNLFNIMFSKQELIKQAFKLESNIIEEEFITKLNENKKINTTNDFKEFFVQEARGNVSGITFEEERIVFICTIGEPTLKTLILKVNEFAKKAKRASYKAVQTDNPKFAMRTWVIRLGLSGDRYKNTRHSILKHLDGNSAFRYYKKEEAL